MDHQDSSVEDAVDEAVVRHDHDLTRSHQQYKRKSEEARRRTGEVIAALNQWRWEMTTCPFGPRYTQESYAGAVGQNHRTIGRGAEAWQAHLDTEAASDSGRHAQNRSGCSFGGEPHHPREVPPPLTDAQVKSHGKAQRRLTAGEVKALLIERLAAHWHVVATTIEVNYRALVNDAKARFHAEHDVESMTPEQVAAAVDALTSAMHQEFKQHEVRERNVQRWMTANRAAEHVVPLADVRKMVAYIERRMEKRDCSWEQAEVEARDWDYRRAEADRMKNELERAARLAVLELQGAVASIELDARRLGRAMQRIEDDQIPLSGDESILVKESLTRAEFVVQQALAAVGGDTKVDWDAALESLMDGES